MLTCIVCANKEISNGDHEDGGRGTPRTKQALKSLTSQIKDMALKASGAYKNSKPCPRPSNNDPSFEGGSVSSRFGFGNSTPRVWGKEMEARLKALSSGASTPVSVSGRTDSVVFMEEDEVKEWVAQVEPGVLITFVSLNHGGNDLKRIRFSREMFNKWQAQRWWSENSEKIMELYNVQHFNQQGVPLPSPPRSEDESSITESIESFPTSSVDADQSARTSSSREADQSGESAIENEWIEQDEPGVYVTIRTLPGGARELRRVRFRMLGHTNVDIFMRLCLCMLYHAFVGGLSERISFTLG
ncbi:Brevis radix-like protein 2 [Tanacetum coccineum]